MNGSAIENSCITKYVYWVLNKIFNPSINPSYIVFTYDMAYASCIPV